MRIIGIPTLNTYLCSVDAVAHASCVQLAMQSFYFTSCLVCTPSDFSFVSLQHQIRIRSEQEISYIEDSLIEWCIAFLQHWQRHKMYTSVSLKIQKNLPIFIQLISLKLFCHPEWMLNSEKSGTTDLWLSNYQTNCEFQFVGLLFVTKKRRSEQKKAVFSVLTTSCNLWLSQKAWKVDVYRCCR